MPQRVAFLRAVNVGGTGKLLMTDLRAAAEAVGCRSVSTYLASGNLLFEADEAPEQLRAVLEDAIAQQTGAKVRLFLRDADILRAVLQALPFADANGAEVGILFGDTPPTKADTNAARNQTDEQIAIAADHLVIHFPSGMGKSKLRLPAMDHATMRNRNTVEAILARLSA